MSIVTTLSLVMAISASEPPGPYPGYGLSKYENIGLDFNGTLFLRQKNRRDPPLAPVRWRQTATAEQIFRSGAKFENKSSLASLKCKLSSNGSLSSCRVTDHSPTTRKWRKYIERLAEQKFSTTRDFARRMRGRVEHLAFNIRINDSKANLDIFTCLPAFCVSHPGPPPPPPPPPPPRPADRY